MGASGSWDIDATMICNVTTRTTVLSCSRVGSLHALRVVPSRPAANHRPSPVVSTVRYSLARFCKIHPWRGDGITVTRSATIMTVRRSTIQGGKQRRLMTGSLTRTSAAAGAAAPGTKKGKVLISVSDKTGLSDLVKVRDWDRGGMLAVGAGGRAACCGRSSWAPPR